MRKCECNPTCDVEIPAKAPFLNVHSYGEKGEFSTRKVLIQHVGEAAMREVDFSSPLRAALDLAEARTASLTDELAEMDKVAKELRSELVTVAGERDEARRELAVLRGGGTV